MYEEVPTKDAFEDLLRRVEILEAASHEHDETPDPQPVSKPLVGMTVGWRSGLTQNQATNDAVELTGRPLRVRRCFDPGMPLSIWRSNLQHDNGVRTQVWSFKPPQDVDTGRLIDLFESIPDRSRVYVTPYHEPRDNMSATEYKRRYRIVREAYNIVGGFAGMGPILTNWGIDNSNGLDYVDSSGVDFLGIDPYADLEQNEDQPIVQSAATAIRVANERGIALNIGEFGVAKNRNGTVSQEQLDWMRSFRDLASQARVEWICYWHDTIWSSTGTATFDCRLAHDGTVAAYQDVYDHYQ